ncbi:MAG: ferredoxin-thioredoxin reductase catalytic domain-containing protein [candidate division WOR-3 bacterium]
MTDIIINNEDIEKLYKELCDTAKNSGYYLNPDIEFTKELIKGLLINERRYGYQACPCRIAQGEKKYDLDIICPCDYRDQDLIEFGTCYCGLYVSKEILKGLKKISPIPERRKLQFEELKDKTSQISKNLEFSLPIWRCKVCGYLCARNQPPLICPICKASQERFERFI